MHRETERAGGPALALAGAPCSRQARTRSTVHGGSVLAGRLRPAHTPAHHTSSPSTGEPGVCTTLAISGLSCMSVGDRKVGKMEGKWTTGVWVRKKKVLGGIPPSRAPAPLPAPHPPTHPPPNPKPQTPTAKPTHPQPLPRTWLAVDVTASLPSCPTTSQAQPLPKTPAVLGCVSRGRAQRWASGAQQGWKRAGGSRWQHLQPCLQRQRQTFPASSAPSQTAGGSVDEWGWGSASRRTVVCEAELGFPGRTAGMLVGLPPTQAGLML